MIRVKFTVRNLLKETLDYNLKGYLLTCNIMRRILNSDSTNITLSEEYVELKSYEKKEITLQFSPPETFGKNKKYLISLWAISPQNSHTFEITNESVQKVVDYNRSKGATIGCDYYELKETQKLTIEDLKKHINKWDKKVQKSENPLFFGGYINMIGYLKKAIPIQDEKSILTKYHLEGREELVQLHHETISGKYVLLNDKLKNQIMPKDTFRFKEYTNFTDFIKSLNKNAIKGFIKEIKEGDIEGLSKEEGNNLIKLIKKIT